MKNFIGKKVLATSTSWFFAPDGKSYKAVYGTLHGILSTEDELGFRPNFKHTNWFVNIGKIVIAGCEILHVIQSNNCNTSDTTEFNTEGGKCTVYNRPSIIYDAD